MNSSTVLILIVLVAVVYLAATGKLSKVITDIRG